MPNVHKHMPTSIRLPESLRKWLKDYADREGIPMIRIIIEALEYVRQCDQERENDAVGRESAVEERRERTHPREQ